MQSADVFAHLHKCKCTCTRQCIKLALAARTCSISFAFKFTTDTHVFNFTCFYILFTSGYWLGGVSKLSTDASPLRNFLYMCVLLGLRCKHPVGVYTLNCMKYKKQATVSWPFPLPSVAYLGRHLHCTLDRHPLYAALLTPTNAYVLYSICIV